MSEDFDPVFTGHVPRFGEKEPGVYFLEQLDTGKLYIGSTVNMYGRYIQHTSALKRGEHANRKLQRAFDKSPFFEMRVAKLHEVPPGKTAIEAVREQEQAVLDSYRGDPRLLNIATDAFASGTRAEISEETRSKLSVAMTGRFVSDETRKRQSEALKGHICTEETKEKIRQSKLGKTQSPERAAKSKAAAMVRAVPVQVGENFFESITAAAEAHDIGQSTARKRIKSQYFDDWKYAAPSL